MPRFLLQGLVNVAGRLPEIFSAIVGIAVSFLFLRFGPSSPVYLVFPLAGLLGLLVFRMVVPHFCRVGIWIVSFLIEQIEGGGLLKVLYLIGGFVLALLALVEFMNLLRSPIWFIVLVAVGESVLFTFVVVRSTTRIRY